tara:strand:- start:744 stop:1145 length:402 start_codon:yes stop_codon:yes gene_type:complete
MAISGSVTRGFTFATGVEITAANLNLLGTPSVSVATPISVGNGGTNATTAANARTNLGLGSIATQASNSIAVTGGTMSGVLITLQSYAVSALPSAGTAGRLVFCTDGDGGNKCLAVDDGTAWKRIALGATVST